MYLSLLFHPFIPRIERVATAATSVGVVPPGVEIAGAPSVVSRVSPLLLCSSAPLLLHFCSSWAFDDQSAAAPSGDNIQ